MLKWLRKHAHQASDAMTALLRFHDGDCAHLWCEGGVCDLCDAAVTLCAHRCEQDRCWQCLTLALCAADSARTIAQERVVELEAQERRPELREDLACEWARSRIQHCRRDEAKFGATWKRQHGPPQALVEAWTERRALQAVLDILEPSQAALEKEVSHEGG